MRREEEEADRDESEELLGRRVLVSVVHLLPHIETVVCTGVELPWDASDIVKHEIGASHVADVCERPREFLADAWKEIKDDLGHGNQDKVDDPGSFVVYP